MMTRLRDEDGVALVVALLVAFVVMLLSTIVVSQAIHNTGQSAYDRKRLTSVNSAEAGLDYYYNYLQAVEPEDLSTAPVTLPLGSAPGAVEFTATPTFYDNDEGGPGHEMTGPFDNNNYPRSVLITSVGTTNDGTERTMESFVVLNPIYGGLTGAVVTNSTTTFTNNFTINGNDGNDGDVYILNGNFDAPSGGQTINGDVYVTNGSATIGTSMHVFGEVWAGGTPPVEAGHVTVSHPQALIDLDVRSTSSYVTVSQGTVVGNAYYCTGSAPGTNVQGSKIQTCDLGPPPTEEFPQIRYTQSAWEDQGYYIHPAFTGASACTDARNYVQGSGDGTFQSGNGVPAGYTGVVVYIDSTCTYGASNNATITLGRNLAILTEGGINLGTRSNWNGSGSTRSLHLMSPYPIGSPSCPTQNVTVGNLTSFNSLVNTFVYSPCTVTMNNNNSAFQGQVMGQTVSIGNLFNMTYKPILVPGAELVGFEQDIAYIREV